MRFYPIRFADGTFGVTFDLSGVKLPDIPDAQEMLTFQIKSYNKISTIATDPDSPPSDDSDWKAMFANVDELFSMMPENMITEYLLTLISIHRNILEFFKTPVDSLGAERLVNQLGEQVDALDLKTDFCTYVQQFVREHVPLGFAEDAGKHVNDSEAMTWYRDQVYDLTTILITCKMMLPVFGEIAARITDIVDRDYRDVLVAQILNQLLNRRFPAIIDKLKYYIKRIISRNLKNKDVKSSGMRGVTLDLTCFQVYSTLLAHKYVNVDLTRLNSNPVTITLANAKQCVNTMAQETSKKYKTANRGPQGAAASSDEDRIAQLEIDSLMSKKTLDVLPLTNFAVVTAINRNIALYQIDRSEFDACMQFYQRHPIAPNVINLNMNAIFYGTELGGAQGLRLLHSDRYTQLTCLLQLIMLSLDTGYTELAHMMTAREAVGQVRDIGYTNVKLNATSSQSYKTIRMMFEDNQFGINGKAWDRHIAGEKGVASKLTGSSWIYNTANFIWDWLETDNLNGRSIDLTSQTIDGMCAMYEYVIFKGVPQE